MAGKPWEKYQVEDERTWTDVATEGFGNLPSSLYGVAEDIYDAVTNPVETGKAILNLASGMMQKNLPEFITKRLDFDPNNEQLATQVIEHFAKKYGSEKEIKKALAEDPASVLADLSTFLTGGGGIVTGTGKLAKMSKVPGGQTVMDVGKKIMTAGTKTDPISLTTAGTLGALNLAGKTAEELAGLASGVGTAPLEEARMVGQTSPVGKPKSEQQKTFEENIKGVADFGDILINAKKGIKNMRTERMQAYRKNQEKLKQDRTVLNFDAIDNALNDAKKYTQYKGKTTNKNAQAVLDEIKGIVDNWKRYGDEYHSPDGFDALKQEISSVIEKIPFEQGKARAVGSDIYNAVKTTIGKQAPVYEKMMRNYSEALKLEKEIEKALSLGNKTSAETAIRKLQSVMRDNVNTGYGTRAEYVKQLEKASDAPIMPAVAGQTLSTRTPRGISRMSALPTIGSAGYFLDPSMALPAAAMSSPRIMGTAENVLGRVQGTMRNLRQNIPISNQGITGLLNLSYQLEQQRERDELFNQQMNMQP